ncbi:thioesterase [Reticulibacter mediterranei]|uniref:Thioesterase n=1 Tax=Reticulibacter mediterranei TaxID=2778369 RepID=A0A8J3IW88_9CHLR|nr:alpha/beta fold hydrolase [Reticulibacter mediterranei]GHO97965.1 thioesterase [Reticulibacter mediterranei]
MSISITRKPILIRAGHSDLSGVYAKPSSAPRALIVALHGGGNSAAIFDNTIPGEAGFLDTAASLGYAVLALDRPGYGTSQQIAEDLRTFDGQITLLRLALTVAWEQYGAESAGIVLLGQSFGGLIVLGLAASHPDVPLLGVSTHGTGLQWLPGALQRFQSKLSDAPFTQLPFDENSKSLGPANSWVHGSIDRLKQSRTPFPMAELREVLHFPEHLRRISAEVRVPVQMTIGEYDTIWESSASALDELSQLFPQAPFVDVRHHRFLPHQPSAHLAARAFYLRELAFVEECRVHNSMIAPSHKHNLAFALDTKDATV